MSRAKKQEVLDTPNEVVPNFVIGTRDHTFVKLLVFGKHLKRGYCLLVATSAA